MNILVNCRGFIGDVLFASSLAKKLKEKYPGCVVHYQIPLVQPLLLLEQNPYIDYVWVGSQKPLIRISNYQLIIVIPEVDQRFPATIQFQAAGGIENQSPEYQVYTLPKFDAEAREMIDALKQKHGKKVIAWQVNWEHRAYQCTQEMFDKHIVAPHRIIWPVIAELEKDFVMVPVGFDRTVSQFDPIAANAESYAKTASVIKYCDWMIGAEGGMTNLAAGVGTRCIITTDWIMQVYGKYGHVKNIENPQMGPAVYFPDAGHIYLDPCITDAQLAPTIKGIING